MALGNPRMTAARTLALAWALASFTSGCLPTAPKPPVATASKAPAKATRPTQIPAGSFQTTKIRVQKVRNFLFTEKATGKILDPAIAQTRAEADVDLQTGDMDELVYDNGKLRYAFYGRTTEEQPYVVEREVGKADYEAMEDGLDADGFWGFDKKTWHQEQRIPFYYVLYTVGDAGYEASFTPTLGRLKKTGPIFDGYIDQMGGGARLPAGTKQMSFAQQGYNGQIIVSVADQAADRAGDAVDTPFKLTGAKVDAGKGVVDALIGPTENAFTYDQPKANGAFMNVSVTLTGADGRVVKTVLPIRALK